MTERLREMMTVVNQHTCTRTDESGTKDGDEADGLERNHESNSETR